MPIEEGVIALQGTLEQIQDRVHELLEERKQKEEERERWCEDVVTALRHVNQCGWDHVLEQFKRMPC